MLVLLASSAGGQWRAGRAPGAAGGGMAPAAGCDRGGAGAGARLQHRGWQVGEQAHVVQLPTPAAPAAAAAMAAAGWRQHSSIHRPSSSPAGAVQGRWSVCLAAVRTVRRHPAGWAATLAVKQSCDMGEGLLWSVGRGMHTGSCIWERQRQHAAPPAATIHQCAKSRTQALPFAGRFYIGASTAACSA